MKKHRQRKFIVAGLWVVVVLLIVGYAIALSGPSHHSESATSQSRTVEGDHATTEDDSFLSTLFAPDASSGRTSETTPPARSFMETNDWADISRKAAGALPNNVMVPGSREGSILLRRLDELERRRFAGKPLSEDEARTYLELRYRKLSDRVAMLEYVRSEHGLHRDEADREQLAEALRKDRNRLEQLRKQYEEQYPR